MRSPLVSAPCVSLLLTSLLLLAVSAFSSAFAAELVAYRFSKPLMGTRFHIICFADDKSSAADAAEDAFEIAKAVELACSDYRQDSEIRVVLDAATPQKVSPILAEVLCKSLEIASLTEGAYDPTIGHHSTNWRRARESGKLPSAERFALAKKMTGWQKIRLDSSGLFHRADSRMRVDLGGIAKGYAADKMLAVLVKAGFPRSSVIAGGDVRLGDPPPGKAGWRVGMKSQPGAAQHFILVSNCGVSTSGDLHQFSIIDGIRYSHIIDPKTGLGLTTPVSATVVAPTATLSDVYATACCVSPALAQKLLMSDRSDSATHRDIHLRYHTESSMTSSPQFPKKQVSIPKQRHE